MPRLVGFSRFDALLEEQIDEKISRRILSGDQGMVVWWSIGAGVHVEPHRLDKGLNEDLIITGGTGKYKGITGSEPFACISMPALAGPGGYFAMDIPHNTTWEIK